MLNVFGMISDRYEALLPWRIPVMAAARKRLVVRSRSRLLPPGARWAGVPRGEAGGPGEGGREEAVGGEIEVEARPHERGLGERPRVEGERDLCRDGLHAV